MRRMRILWGVGGCEIGKARFLEKLSGRLYRGHGKLYFGEAIGQGLLAFRETFDRL